MGLRSLILLAALVVSCSSLIRIPLKKFPSMRSIYAEYGTNIQDLSELGEMLKYKFGGADATTPTPETLKNYMDLQVFALMMNFSHLAQAIKDCGTSYFNTMFSL